MLKTYLNGFLLNLRFLTRIPVPVKVEYDDRAFAAGSAFAPIIGLLIGLIMVGVYLVCAPLDKRALAVFLAMAAGIAVTGGLHLDGLADTFDGLFSYRDKERVLAIMKDSRLGTSGAIALFLVLMLKYLLLVSLAGCPSRRMSGRHAGSFADDHRVERGPFPVRARRTKQALPRGSSSAPASWKSLSPRHWLSSSAFCF